ncbi:MAG: HIT family protein [Gammaproteobacteria bacterium]|nr:HIT family protein [Gammaproteobacteria bacterium]
MCSLHSSNVLLSQDQYFPGWCLVTARRHVVDLFELNDEERFGLETDARTVAFALNNLCNPGRMNYAIFGNVVPHLHWNIIPRYRDDGLWGSPPWPHEPRSIGPAEAHKLASSIRTAIERVIEDVGASFPVKARGQE